MWILIGIQDPSIMERHALNWNIWKGMKSLSELPEKIVYLQGQSRESGASEYIDKVPSRR